LLADSAASIQAEFGRQRARAIAINPNDTQWVTGSSPVRPINPLGSKFDQERILERYYAQNMGTGMNLDAAIDVPTISLPHRSC
jgi:hypothetical protein